MNVQLPSGHTAPLEPAGLARLLSCGGTITGLCRAVLAHPELEPEHLAAASPDDALAVASWALEEFLATDEAAELAAVCERFGQSPAQRLGICDRTLAFHVDQGCVMALERFKDAHKPDEPRGFNAGDING